MTDTSRLADDEPMPAVAAVHALYELGMDDEAIQVNYPKLAGRPAGNVLAFLANVEGRARESWQYHITEYAKHVGRVTGG